MKFLKTSLTAIAFVLSVVVFFGYDVSAQSVETDSSQGIKISPALYELNAEKGKTYEISVDVMNVTLGDLQYSTSIDDFGSSDESGSPKILIDSNLPESSSIKTWLSDIPDFVLKPRQSKKITVYIKIPDDAEPGGHYGVLRFSGTAPNLEGTGVGLSASAGVLILIRVDGAISETASIASFFAVSDNNSQSSFFESGPINFAIRLKNEGNIHIKPSGSIQIHDMFGSVAGEVLVNNVEPRSNVLPDSIRRYDVEFSKEWLFGKYTADLSLGYGTKGQALTKTISFWVIPWKLIMVVLSVVVTIILVLKRLIKVYNRHIIQKSKDEEKNKKNPKS